ncbi:MAG: hypothetical protein K6E49_01065 [Lachnospiraceae bacterium]|nr:hypothetical protein [Lachnospiraceae bacterium]
MIRSDADNTIRKLNADDLNAVIGGIGSGEEGEPVSCPSCGEVFKIRVGRVSAPCPSCGTTVKAKHN